MQSDCDTLLIIFEASVRAAVQKSSLIRSLNHSLTDWPSKSSSRLQNFFFSRWFFEWYLSDTSLFESRFSEQVLSLQPTSQILI